MAWAAAQTVTGAAANANTIILTSWTPAANDIIILAVESRQTTVTHTSVAGNGLTWNKVAELNGGTNIRGSLWWAQGAAPTTGSIVVTLSGSPATSEAVATRLSGADTVAPIEASQSASGTSAAPSLSITTLSANAWVCGAFFGRSGNFTVGSGEIATSINNKTGSSGNILNISTEYQIVASPGAVTIDGTWSASTDWAAIAVSIKEAGAAPAGQPITRRRQGTTEPVARIGRGW